MLRLFPGDGVWMSILENDSMTGSSTPWQQARLAALDLEGSGAQDRDNEAILEIAVIPLSEGQPDLPHAYSTLVNPQRPVPRRPWISPGLTMAALIVGHNVGVLAPAPAAMPVDPPRGVARHPAPGPPRPPRR